MIWVANDCRQIMIHKLKPNTQLVIGVSILSTHCRITSRPFKGGNKVNIESKFVEETKHFKGFANDCKLRVTTYDKLSFFYRETSKKFKVEGDLPGLLGFNLLFSNF